MHFALPDRLSKGAEGNIPKRKRILPGYSLGQTSQKEREMPNSCDYKKYIKKKKKPFLFFAYKTHARLLEVRENYQKVRDLSKWGKQTGKNS